MSHWLDLTKEEKLAQFYHQVRHFFTEKRRRHSW
jgi:hypothetical protein